MNPDAIKALALDMDGTILRSDASLSERTIQALRGCMSRNLRIILCTGRSVQGAEPYRTVLGAEGPMVYFNGAEVVDMPGGQVLDASLLSPEIAGMCVDLAREAGVYVQFFVPSASTGSGEAFYAEREGPESQFYRERTGLWPRFEDLKTILARPDLTGCIKGMFIAEGTILDDLRPRLEARFAGQLTCVRSGGSLLEIVKAGVSKGRGLGIVLKHYGLEAKQVCAFGDEENDLPLFTAAGFSAAPANAKPSLQSIADFHIPSNDEDGVASFLEEVFIIEQKLP